MQEPVVDTLVRVHYRPKSWYFATGTHPGEKGPYRTLDDCLRAAVPEGSEKLVKLPGGCIRRISIHRGRAQMATA